MTGPNVVADLLIHNALVVATVDDQRRELSGGWVAITDGIITGVGSSLDIKPDAREVLDATDCLVTPGLVNTHHHMYQNLTRANPLMTDKPLFGWLQSLYPLWRAIDEEAVYVSAYIALAELALSGCTTSSDHLYLHPHGAGDLLSAEIRAAQDLGMRSTQRVVQCLFRKKTVVCHLMMLSATTMKFWRSVSKRCISITIAHSVQWCV